MEQMFWLHSMVTGRASVLFGVTLLSVILAVQVAEGAVLRSQQSVRSGNATSRAAAPSSVRIPQSSPSFASHFSGNALDSSQWKMAGPYANGQPFLNGWDPSLGYVQGGSLNLQLKKQDFFDHSATGGGGGTHYPFSSGEVRSLQFYGEGCYSACMKPCAISGVSSSFYIQTGEHDTPPDAGRAANIHNEIDIEFIGKDPRLVQTNHFSRWKDPHANSASGNEEVHYLEYDASSQFSVYSFKWTKDRITWYVNGQVIRKVESNEQIIPSPLYSTMRIAANIWPVNSQAEEWAGPKPEDLTYAEAHYKWIAFDQGSDCSVKSSC